MPPPDAPGGDLGRFGLIVLPAIALAALFAWYIKGDLEMGWFVAGPAIAGVSLLLALAGSLFAPAGFPRAAIGLAAMPFGLLLAWLAATTPNSWPIAPAAETLRRARAIADDPVALQQWAAETVGIPVETYGATVDSVDGFKRKESGRFGLTRREPVVRIAVAFAVGPVQSLRLRLTDGGDPVPEPPLPDPARLTVRADAILRRYPAAAFIEVGGQSPFAPGAALPLRLLQGADDWSIALLRVAAAGEPLQLVRGWSRADIMTGFAGALRARGERPARITTYFQPAGDRLLFLRGPSFDFHAALEGGGTADLRARIDADSAVWEVLAVRRAP